MQYGSSTGYVASQYLSVSTVTTTPDAAPAPTPSTTVTGRITADVGLNLRRGRNRYGVILTIPYNMTVTVLDRSNSAWYKVQYGSSTGYVASQYLSVSTVTTTPDAAPAPTPSTTVTGRITADVGLNLRRGAEQMRCDFDDSVQHDGDGF